MYTLVGTREGGETDSKGKTKRVLLGEAWLFQENRWEIRKLVMIFV